MASTWQNHYMVAALERGLRDKFKDIQDESHVLIFLKMLIEKLRSATKFNDCLQSFISGWEFILLTKVEDDNRNQVALYADCLCEASRHVLLTGEWMQQEQATKDYLKENISKCEKIIPNRKDEINRVSNLVSEPWSAPGVRSLLTGQVEQQQQVLELVSSEGVDLVLLRIEMLIESGLDLAAYKFVAAVANSLLADHIVFQSYVSTSSPGSLERIVDIFLALAVATRHESRVYKLMRHIGQETLHTVYMRRFKAYLDMDQEGNNVIKEEKGGQEPEEKDNDDSQLHLCEKGRCERLFSRIVCLKVLEIFLQYSLAGASVKECPLAMQEELITSYLEKFGDDKEKVLDDVDVLMESASQTSFLYSLASHLWHKFGKEVEERCLRMFIRGLTSDMNAQEAAKKTKQLKHKIEERMARGYWLLSQVVHDRVSLARECVLTAFSIKPSEELLDKIREFATLSGLDKLEEEEPELDDSLHELVDSKSGLHCRVTLGEESKAAQVFTKLHMANMMKHLATTPSAQENFSRMDSLSASEDQFEAVCSQLTESLQTTRFSRAETKLRSNKTRHRKKVRNLEGILAIQGELITEAANYDPLDEPCKSLKPENLGLSRQITDDLIIVISAPRWHLLSWVMAWTELEKTCCNLLKDPTLREPNEELKYLNIDYTQFDEWSSDEEVTIYTGIEKGYERWLQQPAEDQTFKEEGLSSDEEDINFKAEHTIDREDYDNLDKYIGSNDYLSVGETSARKTEPSVAETAPPGATALSPAASSPVAALSAEAAPSPVPMQIQAAAASPAAVQSIAVALSPAAAPSPTAVPRAAASSLAGVSSPSEATAPSPATEPSPQPAPYPSAILSPACPAAVPLLSASSPVPSPAPAAVSPAADCPSSTEAAESVSPPVSGDGTADSVSTAADAPACSGQPGSDGEPMDVTEGNSGNAVPIPVDN